MHEKYPLSAQMHDFVEHCESFFPDEILKRGVDGQRIAYNAMTNSLAREMPSSLIISDLEIAGVKARRYSSSSSSSTQSQSESKTTETILYAHGGGWYLGGLESHHSFCADVAERCNVNLIAIDYRLAPEFPFPAGLNDCYSVYQALLEQRITPILMGDSAGANLMAALTMQCKQDQLAQAKAQILIYPAFALPGSLPSHQSFADAPLLSTQSIKVCFDNYMKGSEQKDTQSPLLFPLQASSFSGLPDAAIFAAQYDPLVDDAVCYSKKLQQQNVQADCTTILGLVHGGLHAINRCDEADELLEKVCQAVNGFIEED